MTSDPPTIHTADDGRRYINADQVTWFDNLVRTRGEERAESARLHAENFELRKQGNSTMDDVGEVIGREDRIRTMYWHSHNADGSERADHCCGCWNVIYNERGLFLRCNECGEERSLAPMVDPANSAIPIGVPA